MKLFIGFLLVATGLAAAQQSYGPPTQSFSSGSRGFSGGSRAHSSGSRGTGFSGSSGGSSFSGSSSGQYSGQGQRGPVIPIVSFNQEGPIDGSYAFDFETGNGIRRQEQGSPTGPDGSVVQQGSWSFTFPDGTPAEFSFVADENGYRVESPLLPVGPPLPPHAIAQIEKAERERAQGIVHDGSYRPQGGSGGQTYQRPTQNFQQANRRPSGSQGQRGYGYN